jgi:hypothetical protein
MNKSEVNGLYLYIAAAFSAIVVVDTLLNIHPWGNIVGAVILLVACYKIGKSAKK